ncbi:MAG TPA: FHA domain-containing protein [Actinophytocola sp.]|uniref:FHA domain-containing protein n=1 Tax=Actinophytocola sp. TaxID=1872138 RepID=UPI002DBD495D|nr:FHA domain-containing protein [Actinophytocola sp.]HEU5475578.1 FHA domain-containing protein [Actinophytocola sp.]
MDNRTGTNGAPAEARNLVHGVYCRRSHFNDPRMNYCTVCGISMTQATRLPVLGERPALGVLVLDDGTMFPLDREHVLGRGPETDPAVRDGSAKPVRLTDMSVSRVHARIVLNDWDVKVTDVGSTNGTFICPQGESEWTRILPGNQAALRSGAMVVLGRRRLRYHSHRAQSEDFSELENAWVLENSYKQRPSQAA